MGVYAPGRSPLLEAAAREKTSGRGGSLIAGVYGRGESFTSPPQHMVEVGEPRSAHMAGGGEREGGGESRDSRRTAASAASGAGGGKHGYTPSAPAEGVSWERETIETAAPGSLGGTSNKHPEFGGDDASANNRGGTAGTGVPSRGSGVSGWSRSSATGGEGNAPLEGGAPAVSKPRTFPAGGPASAPPPRAMPSGQAHIRPRVPGVQVSGVPKAGGARPTQGLEAYPVLLEMVEAKFGTSAPAFLFGMNGTKVVPGSITGIQARPPNLLLLYYS